MVERPAQIRPEPTLLVREFISTSHDSDLARNTTERQRLEQMAVALQREKAALRIKQRLQGVVWVLLFCIIIGTVAWSHRSYVEEQIYWHLTMRLSSSTTVKERERQPYQTFSDCRNGCPEMVVLPSGKYTMNSLDPKVDTRELPVKSFAVAKYETTFAEWDVCIMAGGCPKAIDVWGRGKMPVVNISWAEADLYTKWLSKVTRKKYSMLTEEQWEYAARAGQAPSPTLVLPTMPIVPTVETVGANGEERGLRRLANSQPIPMALMI